MSKDRFNIWYNKWLGRIDEEADESLWNEIEDELDFHETWENIAGRLDKIDRSVKPVTKRKSYLKEIIGIAASILLILATAKYISDKSHEMSVSADNIALTGRHTDQKVKAISDNALRQAGSGIMGAGISGRRANPEFFLTEREFDRQEAGRTRMDNRIMARTGLAEKQPLTVYSFDNKRLEMTLADHSGYSPVQNKLPDNISESDGRRNLIGFKDAGIVFGYKNTWLLNHETYNGLNPSKLNSALPTYRQEIGAATTMVIKQRTAIGMEFFWRSEIGQKYQQYVNASYIDRNINLDYLKFQAFYLWDPARVPGEVLLGGYYSILKTGKETRGEDSFNIRQNYSDTDYGFLLGYQLKINVQGSLVVKPGVRFNYNIRNIFEGDNIVPSHLKKTNSFSAGFNISLFYNFY
ncbi:MAG: hypothetical protein R6U58_05230 [Bacteroidales bacterium]